jgi:hypothetical protein
VATAGSVPKAIAYGSHDQTVAFSPRLYAHPQTTISSAAVPARQPVLAVAPFDPRDAGHREDLHEEQVGGEASPGLAAAPTGVTASAVSVSPDTAAARTRRPFMINLLLG